MFTTGRKYVNTPLDISPEFTRRIWESIDLQPLQPEDYPKVPQVQCPAQEVGPVVAQRKFKNKKLNLSTDFIRRIWESIDLQPYIEGEKDRNIFNLSSSDPKYPKRNSTRKNRQSGGIIYMKNIRQLDNFSIHPGYELYEFIKPKFIYNNSALIDYVWLQKQLKYIYGLSNSQKHLLHLYTNGYDKIVNTYLRNKSRTIQDKSIETNILELDAIIENAPILDRNIAVFRGVSDGSFLKFDAN